MAEVTIYSDFGAQENSLTVSIVSPSICHVYVMLIYVLHVYKLILCIYCGCLCIYFLYICAIYALYISEMNKSNNIRN